jgi:hypothetical protein
MPLNPPNKYRVFYAENLDLTSTLENLEAEGWEICNIHLESNEATNRIIARKPRA